jgi:hypothetical protein
LLLGHCPFLPLQRLLLLLCCRVLLPLLLLS